MSDRFMDAIEEECARLTPEDKEAFKGLLREICEELRADKEKEEDE